MTASPASRSPRERAMARPPGHTRSGPTGLPSTVELAISLLVARMRWRSDSLSSMRWVVVRGTICRRCRQRWQSRELQEGFREQPEASPELPQAPRPLPAAPQEMPEVCRQPVQLRACSASGRGSHLGAGVEVGEGVADSGHGDLPAAHHRQRGSAARGLEAALDLGVTAHKCGAHRRREPRQQGVLRRPGAGGRLVCACHLLRGAEDGWASAGSW